MKPLWAGLALAAAVVVGYLAAWFSIHSRIADLELSRANLRKALSTIVFHISAFNIRGAADIKIVQEELWRTVEKTASTALRQDDRMGP